MPPAAGPLIAFMGVIATLLILIMVWRFVGASKPVTPPLQTGAQKPTGGYLGALARANKKGKSMDASLTMRQIGQAFTMYVLDHNDALPNDLQQLEPYLAGLDRMLRDPNSGQARFMYTKPAARMGQILNPSHTPIVYEAHNGQPKPGGAVLFADGRVEMGQ